VKHDFYTSKDISIHDSWGQLNIVDGGLSLCKVCGGLEGALTTDCPGVRMPHDTEKSVYEGEIDYLEGKGWVHQASKHSPVYWELKRKGENYID
jgi:hypothetical protein